MKNSYLRLVLLGFVLLGAGCEQAVTQSEAKMEGTPPPAFGKKPGLDVNGAPDAK